MLFYKSHANCVNNNCITSIQVFHVDNYAYKHKCSQKQLTFMPISGWANIYMANIFS